MPLADLETYQRFIIVAHRGDMNPVDGYPEGTLEGYRQAVLKGVHRVDLDLRRSSEGTWHVMHDSTVSRTTDGSGAISSLTDAQIAALTIDGGLGYDAGRHIGLKVPTLATVLESCAPYDVTFQLDNKEGTGGATSLATMAVAEGIANRVLINAYSQAEAQAVKAVDASIAVVGDSAWSETDWLTPAYSSVTSLAYSTALAPRPVCGVMAAADFGIVDDGQVTRDLYARGARGIVANDIDAALAALREIESPPHQVAKTFTFGTMGALAVGRLTAAIPATEDLTVSGVAINVHPDFPPDGAAIIADVYKNGTTLFTSQNNRPSIADGQVAGSVAVPDVTAIAKDDLIEVDIDQVGSVTPGSHLIVQVRCVVGG